MLHMLHKGQFAGHNIEDTPTWYLDYVIKHWENEDLVKAAEVELCWRKHLGQRPGSNVKEPA